MKKLHIGDNAMLENNAHVFPGDTFNIDLLSSPVLSDCKYITTGFTQPN